MLFLQGMGKHVDHYQFMGDELSAHGIRVHCFDFRGQGETLIRNSDKLSRGNIGTLDQVKADIDLFLTGLDLDVSVPRILVERVIDSLIDNLLVVGWLEYGRIAVSDDWA